MLALLGHIITFVIAWLIVIVGALGLLLAIGVMLADLISLFFLLLAKRLTSFTDGISNRTVLGFGGKQPIAVLSPVIFLYVKT